MRMHCLIQLNIVLQVSGITSGRAAALVPAALGLLSVIAGWIAFRRSKKQIENVRITAIITLGAAGVGLILSLSHLLRTSASNLGTGSGKLGAIVALVLSLIGLFLGVIAFGRSNKKK